MTDQETKELFRVLGNMPKFRQWLAEKEHENTRGLKMAVEPFVFYKRQGIAAILDEMQSLIDK